MVFISFGGFFTLSTFTLYKPFTGSKLGINLYMHDQGCSE